jgi:sRNA-binding carbon storage regulator CsrA
VVKVGVDAPRHQPVVRQIFSAATSESNRAWCWGEDTP